MSFARLPERFTPWVEDDIRSGRWYRSRRLMTIIPSLGFPLILSPDGLWFRLIMTLVMAAFVAWYTVYGDSRHLRKEAVLQLRYQRGEITRRERADTRMPNHWPTTAAVLLAAAVVIASVLLLA